MVAIVIPPDPLVSLEEVKVALGESGNDRDDLIEGLLWAAQSELDGPNGWVGISVAQQTAMIKANAFEPAIRLIGGPVISAAILYLSEDGTEQVLDSASYVVAPDGTISLAAGSSWPVLAKQGSGISVTYDVGIDDPDDPRVQQMRTAIIMHVRMTMDGIEPEVSRKAIEAIVRPLWVPVC